MSTPSIRKVDNTEKKQGRGEIRIVTEIFATKIVVIWLYEGRPTSTVMLVPIDKPDYSYLLVIKYSIQSSIVSNIEYSIVPHNNNI